jgi:hypothetical protein
MLNRLGKLVWEAGGLPILVKMIEDGSVDRQLVASVLRTSGQESESLLLKLMKYHKSDRVRMAAASVLSYRLPVDEYQLSIDLVVDQISNFRNNDFTPGQVCRYIGPLTSLILEQSEVASDEHIGPYMEVN